jgi:flagellar protein FliS
MQPHARENYLVTEVMTATPQKLQLMMIEAAIRFGHQARTQWQAGEAHQASESLIRCQQIMAQLLGGLKPELEPALVQRVAGVYVFVFNCFVHAHLNQDQKQLDNALDVLAVEQETWRLVCDKLGSRRSEADAAAERFAVEA